MVAGLLMRSCWEEISSTPSGFLAQGVAYNVWQYEQNFIITREWLKVDKVQNTKNDLT